MDTQFMDGALYEFEKSYGVMLTIRDFVSNVNAETGEKVQFRKDTVVRAIQLPIKTAREFFQDVGYLRANSNFTYGGVDTFKTVTVIVRKKRLQHLDMSVDLNRDAVLGGKRYDTVSVEDIGAAWEINLKNVGNSTVYQDIAVKVEDGLSIGENA
jgi:hypothetical protein